MRYGYLLIALVAILAFLFAVMATWIRCYAKVGPNQVLIVSGRKIQLPDGRFAGVRIVKGGGTFVFPVIERADVLSLEIITIEMPRSKVQTAGGRAMQADCVAQVKVNNDDVSIMAAAEHFLSRSGAEIGNSVRPVLEKSLHRALECSSIEEAMQNPAACAARVQTAAAADLGQMGLSLISLTIRDAHAA